MGGRHARLLGWSMAVSTAVVVGGVVVQAPPATADPPAAGLAAAGLPTAPVGAAPAVPGLTYYVSGQGSDTAAGSQEAPWRTIQKATSTAPAGATIVVGTGSYGPFAVTKHGQTVQADTGASVQVRGTAGARDV